MNHYETLGVSETASQEEIKKAYRKLATKHHPDKGGDTATFQKIAAAYETVGDQNKRAQYDAQRQGGHSGGFDPFAQAAAMGQEWQDVSAMFGGNPFEQFFRGARQTSRRKNRDLNIRITVGFKQSYTGCDLEASYQMPNGKKQTVVIQVPPGIVSGQVIRYGGMGDDTDPAVPKGDLNVTVMVENSQHFERRGNDLVTYTLINPVEAMIGCTKVVNHVSGSSIRFKIRPGVGHGTEFASPNLGFTDLRGGKGNFIIVIGIEIPAVTDPEITEELEKIYAKVQNSLDSKS
jgi:DnaJ-class molecular chaperone